MENAVAPLLAAKHLQAILSQPNVRLLDVRTGPKAAVAYTEGHLPHAVRADLETDLADVPPNAAQGGRHPLPPIADFTARLGQWGIGPETHVIVYDDQRGANAAARAWWMLRSLGHQRVQVLDGGLQAAIEAGIALTTIVPENQSLSAYPAHIWQWPQADMEMVAQVAQDSAYVVIDVRDAYRYRGDREPIDLVAGHIPGAINVPFSENLTENGTFRDAATLRQQYEAVLQGRDAAQVVVHCGSGVTACHTLLAMTQAGFAPARLYVGSWSEWSRNDQPMAKSAD